jgi:outer membrane usher protein FimD/PapC
MTIGQKITFSSQFVKAQGTWQVMKVWQDGRVWLAKLGKKGQLLTPNQDNQMNVPVTTISEALVIGTATLI